MNAEYAVLSVYPLSSASNFQRPVTEFLDDPDFGLSAGELAALHAGPYGQGTLSDGSQVGFPIHQSAWVYVFGGDLVNETRDAYTLMLDVALFLNDLQASSCTFATGSFPNPQISTIARFQLAGWFSLQSSPIMNEAAAREKLAAASTNNRNSLYS